MSAFLGSGAAETPDVIAAAMESGTKRLTRRLFISELTFGRRFPIAD
jgi:hypothetical protein